jgi:hypothetical protein
LHYTSSNEKQKTALTESKYSPSLSYTTSPTQTRVLLQTVRHVVVTRVLARYGSCSFHVYVCSPSLPCEREQALSVWLGERANAESVLTSASRTCSISMQRALSILANPIHCRIADRLIHRTVMPLEPGVRAHRERAAPTLTVRVSPSFISRFLKPQKISHFAIQVDAQHPQRMKRNFFERVVC